jgi:hypothetical protein
MRGVKGTPTISIAIFLSNLFAHPISAYLSIAVHNWSLCCRIAVFTTLFQMLLTTTMAKESVKRHKAWIVKASTELKEHHPDGGVKPFLRSMCVVVKSI